MGGFKDELEGVPMDHFSSLNPKVYAFQTAENQETRKAKGVSKVVIKKEINKSDYTHVLNTGEHINKDVYAIRSMEHKVYTIKTNKTCLTPWYDKIEVVHNMNCVPFGYKGNNI